MIWFPYDIAVKLAMATQQRVNTSGLCCDAKSSYSIEPGFPNSVPCIQHWQARKY